jgi:signal transduction histidine kinase
MKNEWEMYSYASSFVTSLVLVLFAWQLSNVLGTTSLYLVFIIAIILNAWLGGLKSGLIITASGFASALFFVVIQESDDKLVQSFEAILFVLAGILLSFVIEKYKKTNLVTIYKTRNKHLKEEIVKMQSEAVKMQEEIRMLDEFLSIASHELKTPLTSMLLKIQMILHNIRNVSLANFSVQKLLDQLETAEVQTKRLSRMINDLLNVSLITTGKMNIEPQKENVTEIVKEVASEFAEKLESQGYEFRLTENGPIEAYVDKLRIAQVITNLISNAIRYGDNKPIDVITDVTGNFARITVKDRGLGIEEDQQTKIFKLFERGVPKNGIKGLGVGLYVSNQIVKAHGGSIRVESKPDHGSTFTVLLPLQTN